MPQEPRDFAQWTKSVERRLQQALRAGQSPQAVRLARDLHEVRGEVADNARVPAAPVELVTETRVLPDLTGAPRGEVSVSFAPVTVDVNANPIEVDRYELWLETVEPEAEEEEEPGDGDFVWEEDNSWRTNLVADTESEYWRSRNTPRTKQVADLQEGEDFVAGDRIRFSVTADTFGRNPLEGTFDELMHSVRLSAHRKVYEGDPMPWDIEEEEPAFEEPGEDQEWPEEPEEEEEDPRDFEIVEHADWQISVLPTGTQEDTSTRTVETYTLEAEVPKGTTRITAHFAGTVRAGHIEFINPVLFNMNETKPEPPAVQSARMVSTSFEPRLSYSPLDVDGEYEVKVRAIAGTQAGPMSVTRRVKIEADRTPPPIPSALELSSSGATVMASWDLLAGTGDPMPPDFSHTEVAYGYLPPPTEIAGTITILFSQYIFETPQQPDDVEFDGTWYFRHRAVDTSGNKSPWSATSSIVPKQLVDTAALQFELDEFNRERIDPLEASINDEVSKAQDAIQAIRDEWDDQWDREEIDALIQRQETFDEDLTRGLAGADQRISSLSVGDLFVENALKARTIDMESLTADRAFLDHAMVNLIQGRMANFDQALIGGTLLKDNSVATRHMVIGNTDELWNDAWWEDLLDSAYIFSPGDTMGSSAFRRNFHSESPDSVGSSSFDWRYTTLQGDRGIQTWPSNSSINQRAAFRLGPGKGIPVRPGEKYTFRARYRDRNGSGFFNIDMALFDVETGEAVPVGDSPRFVASGIVHSGDQEAIWTFEIPNNFPRMHMVPSINSENNSESGARSLLRPQLFRAMDGKLIVDGLLQATTGVLDELFFDTAVGNSIAAGAGRFLTIETGNLAANAVTADKISFGSLNGALITGLQIQTHTNNRGVKMTSDGIRAFNSSGTETFTVNASNGSVTARNGTFTAGEFVGGTISGSNMMVTSEIQLGARYTGVGSGSGGVRLRNNGSGGSILAYDDSGSISARIGGGRHYFAGDLRADSLNLTGHLRVGAGSASEGGLTPVGDRLDIRGRVPELDNMSGETTFMAMTTPYSRARDWYANFDSGQLKLVRITYPKSAPRGARLPLAIMNINGSNSPGRGASASITRNRTNSYFNLAMGYSDSITTGANPRFAITILSTWGQTTPGGFVGT